MKRQKRIYLVCFIIVIIGSLFNSFIYAKTNLKNGWHLVPDVTGNDKNWAYYYNGHEQKRYSKLVCAHRGWGTAPENSLESFKTTYEKGYYCLETDIRFTKDNIPVLLHDETINRVARNKDLSKISTEINVNDLTLKELNKYVFNVSRNGKELNNYSKNKITTLESTLQFASKKGIFLELELKEGTKEQIASIVKMVKKYNLNNVVYWISFDYQLLKYVKEADDSEFLGLISANGYRDQIDTIYDNLKTPNNLVKVPNVIGSTNFYTITPNLPEELNVYKNETYKLTNDIFSTKIETTKYIVDNSSMTISRVPPGTTLKIIKKNIATTGKITAKNNNIDLNDNTKITTGSTIDANFEDNKSNHHLNYKISVLGDLNGDGEIKISDIQKLYKALKGKQTLTNIEKMAGDINNDNEIRINDIYKLYSYLKGKTSSLE